MTSLPSYFRTRVGKPVTWSFQTGSRRHGEAFRRDYLIVPRGVDRDVLVASVTSHDFDSTGNRTTRTPVDRSPARVSLAGLTDPAAALEELCRAVDPGHFANHPRAKPADAPVEGLEQRLADLDSSGNRGKDEVAPLPASVARIKRFWTENPGLLLPDVFSSKDGILRARWMEGKDRTAWVNFPATGPLGFSASAPRDGGYGLMKINARCIDDQDVVPTVERLGVRCMRPK